MSLLLTFDDPIQLYQQKNTTLRPKQDPNLSCFSVKNRRYHDMQEKGC